MSLIYKVDIFQKLTESGYSSYVFRKTNLISQGTLKRLKDKQGLSSDTMDKICQLLDCQLSDLWDIIPDEEITKEKKNILTRQEERLLKYRELLLQNK